MLSFFVRIYRYYFGFRLERIVAPRHAFWMWLMKTTAHSFFPHDSHDDDDLITHRTDTKAQRQVLHDNDDDDDNDNDNDDLLLWHLVHLLRHHHHRGGNHHQQPQPWLYQFLSSCGNINAFATFCTQQQQQLLSLLLMTMEVDNSTADNTTFSSSSITVTHTLIEAFENIFHRGILSAARNEHHHTHTHHQQQQQQQQQKCHWTTTCLPMKLLRSDTLIRLLVSHGANVYARDSRRGVSLLHWAAGAGNIHGLHELLRYHHPIRVISSDQIMESSENRGDNDNDYSVDGDGIWTRAYRDGSTLLHWAAAGASAHHFGTGGHCEVCQYLISQVLHDNERSMYVNAMTNEGNTPLMWASWSGTIASVKLLLQYDANWRIQNKNGCTVAHWAASGGNLEVCRYLHHVVGVDFTCRNHAGNTPLSHAVAFGRIDIVEWLQSTAMTPIADYEVAHRLAYDFVQWGSSNDTYQRQEILDSFGELR
jgi:ankyrin repeat protein